ncbi:transmembrane channel-like protein 8 isoform X2 [Spea bombifrons]|uniref:transmembrane channel-like protein 8 isoform X2 n=1 Tax=Spea bombifrons TaxID=233779 RepID=UPI0023497496|nr:transmembrane channel-like protein 8 isoform X2 [Spea bombifrons]
MRGTLQRWRSKAKHDDLRHHPLSMQEKRRLREGMQIKNPGRTSWGSFGRRVNLRPARDKGLQILTACKLWERTLIEISGRFGSGICSYFSFLRSLILLNFASLIFNCGFLVIPTLSFTETGVNHSTSDGPCENSLSTHKTSPEGTLFDIFTGEGVLKNSLLFYGHYTNRTADGSLFNIRLVYVLLPLIYLLACGVCLLRWTVQGITKRRVRTRDYTTRISAKVFSGWDFCAREEEMSTLKQQSLSNDIKSHLAEELWILDMEGQTLCTRVRVIVARVLINFMILALLGGAFYSIHLATGISQDYQEKEVAPALGLIIQYLVPIVITLVLLILPPIFMLLVKFEGHSPSAEITLTLIRCVFLRLGTLAIFFFSLAQNILCLGSSESSCEACGYNTNFQCWETSVGQEFYKLSVFHFLNVLVDFLLLQMPRRILVTRLKWRVVLWLGKEKFQLPQNVLDTVYGQTLMWGGLFYAPLLPLLNIVFLFITFYIKKFSLYRLCDPSHKFFRESTSRILFYFVLFLGLLTTFLPLIYMVTSVRPSRSCGLFTDHSTAWEVVHNSTMSILPPMAITTLSHLSSDLLPKSLLIILSITLTSYVSRVRQHEEIIEDLKVHLAHQIQDKEFLVRKLREEDILGQQELDNHAEDHRGLN